MLKAEAEGWSVLTSGGEAAACLNLRVYVPAAEGEGRQQDQREGDEREAPEIPPVDAVFYGGAVVVEGGGGLEVFEVF